MPEKRNETKSKRQRLNKKGTYIKTVHSDGMDEKTTSSETVNNANDPKIKEINCIGLNLTD